MKNITLSVDDEILSEVRLIAARKKTTVNAMVREYLTRMASEESRIAEARKAMRELIDKSSARLGPDYVWNREETYAGRVFPRHQHSDLRGSRKK